MKKIIVFLLILVLAAVTITGCGSNGESENASAEPIHLKFSTAVSENSSWQEGAVKFAEIINERTDGKYVVDIYPSDQLTSGNQVKALEAIQTGATQFDIRSILLYTNYDEKFTAIMMPWMVPTYEEVDSILAGEGGKAIEDLVNSYGMKFLAFGESGYRQLTNNVSPINEPNDLKDMKIRVPAINMYFDLFNAFGANPTTMNMGEVFAAIQQGTVDGQENPVDVIRSFKVNEVCNYISMWNCSYDPIIMSVSPVFYDKLSSEEQEIFADAAVEAMDYQKEQVRAQYDEILAEFETTSEVNELTLDQIAEFKETVQPVYDKWVDIIGADFMEKFGYKAK